MSFGWVTLELVQPQPAELSAAVIPAESMRCQTTGSVSLL